MNAYFLVMNSKRCTLANARQFYSSMGNPLDGKGLILMDFLIPLVIHCFDSRIILRFHNERIGACLLISVFNLL